MIGHTADPTVPLPSGRFATLGPCSWSTSPAQIVVCECGSGTVLVSVAELDTGAPVIELRFDRTDRPLAA
jgi:hypothetical protein